MDKDLKLQLIQQFKKEFKECCEGGITLLEFLKNKMEEMEQPAAAPKEEATAAPKQEQAAIKTDYSDTPNYEKRCASYQKLISQYKLLATSLIAETVSEETADEVYCGLMDLQQAIEEGYLDNMR